MAEEEVDQVLGIEEEDDEKFPVFPSIQVNPVGNLESESKHYVYISPNNSNK